MASTGSRRWRWAPALFLLVAAPLIAEVLPGATRMRSIFVLPIEMGVWGVGALFIREAVRRMGLGWRNMLLLGFGLAIAEEFLIQQTSLATLVIEIQKGAPYARDFGVNWLYLTWALFYESVLVVMVPVALAELVFPERRSEGWLSTGGAIACTVYFAIACFLAWFSWTRIVRPKIFHLPIYNPPPVMLAIGAGAILFLVAIALGPTRRWLAKPAKPLSAPRPWLVFALSVVPPVLWYLLVLLAFGVRTDFPPGVAAAGALLLVAGVLAVFPRWVADPAWSDMHSYATVFGVMIGSMGAGYIGFGADPVDLGGKIVMNVLAVLLMVALGRKVARR
jgi:hypothetical protein